LQAIKVHNQ